MKSAVTLKAIRIMAAATAMISIPLVLPAQTQQEYPDQSPEAQQSAAPQTPQQGSTSSSHGGFRRVGDPIQAPMQSRASYPQWSQLQWSQQQSPQANQPPTYATDQNEGAPNQNQPNQNQFPQNQGSQNPNFQNQGPMPSPANQASVYSIPNQLTIALGTFITVRVNQTISTDRNQAGDSFTASLVRPLIVNGIIVAERGQTIGGRVSEAQKAGRVEGTSRLGLQLTDLSLVDGQQVPIQSQFVNRNGGTSYGRDAAGIGTSTALGAGIGAAAGGGFGAGVGAASGALVGVVGVLLTRGHPSIVYPESVLTFRIEAPVIISTERSGQAFRYVQNGDYDQPQDHRRPPTDYAYNGSTGYPVPPTPYDYSYGYPYYYGPSFSLFYGPGFGYGYGYGRGFYGGGFYGGGFYGGGFRGGFHGGGRGGRR